jgi:YHS domain-containing protein
LIQADRKEIKIMAMDPVCHMEVAEETAQWTSEHEGQTYYFCAPGCKVSFDKDPEKYPGHSEEEHDHHHH